jgi:hypothetical protein
MTALVCLTIAIACALISRILLLIAALDISVWWAVGVFLPFGPSLFRLSYPDAARSSFIFRVATLLCFFLFVVFGPAAGLGPTYKPKPRQAEAGKGYASEIAKKFARFRASKAKADPLTLNDQRLANAREFERLNKWKEALQIQKRDLSQSDVEGNRAYAIDLEEYNSALAAATVEKQILATAPVGD